MLQNIKLLDGMHEGILILKKNDHSAMFCNYAALKVVSNLSSTNGSQPLVIKTLAEITKEVLKAEAFKPIKLTVQENAESRLTR